MFKKIKIFHALSFLASIALFISIAISGIHDNLNEFYITNVALFLIIIVSNMIISKIELEQNRQIFFISETLDNLSSLIITTDIFGKIIYANKAITKIMGFNKKDVIGKNIKILGENPNKGSTKKYIIEQTLKNGYWNGETVSFDQKGNEHLMGMNTLIIKDEEQKNSYIISVARDITEVKRFRQKEDQLIKNLKLSQTFSVQLASVIAGLNHEVSPWLGGAKNIVSRLKSLLSRVTPEDKESCDKAKVTINNKLGDLGECLDKSTDILLMMSKNVKRMESYTITHTSILKSVNAWKNITLTSKTIEKLEKDEITLDEKSLDFKTDHSPLLLSQVLLNLTKNSIEHNSDNAKKLKIKIYGVPNRKTLIFQDNGKGISKEQIEDIFKIRATTKQDLHEIHGLGLALSQDYCRNMNANIWAEYCEEGAKFCIKFENISSSYGGDKIELKKPLTIILTDNDSDTNNILIHHIKKHFSSNLEIVQSDNGLDLLLFLKAYKTDIVILNMLLKDMCSKDICKTIRTNPNIKNTFIIGITNISDNEDIDKINDSEIDDYILKPIDLNDLILKIKDYASRNDLI